MLPVRIDWDQNWGEQGTWPTKTFVSVWFKNETNMSTMIGMLEIGKNGLKKVPYKLHGQEVSARLEISPKRKPWAKAHALFYKGLEEAGGNEKNVVFGGNSDQFLCGKCSGREIHS